MPINVFAQSCVQPPTGIIAWWPFDETEGATAEDRIGNHPGAHTNGPVPADGMVGGSLRFDGRNDYVAVADSDLWSFGSNNFTLEFWANFDAAGGGSIGHPGDIFIGHDDGPGTRNKWFFALGGGALNFHINGRSTGSRFFPRAPFSPTVGEWYHLAITRDGSLYTIYVNGEPAASTTDTRIIPNSSAPLTIGQAEFLGFMNGRLDEVSIYNRALSEDELRAISDAGGEGKCKELQIRPVAGGDTGRVTVTITGGVFEEGTSVKLVYPGEPDIVGEFVKVEHDGRVITTSFDLSDQARGLRDVVIESPSNTVSTLEEGFTVEAGIVQDLWIDVVGLNLIRPGRPQTFYITVGNSSNVDKYNASIMLGGIPHDVETRALFPLPFDSVPNELEGSGIDKSIFRFIEEKTLSSVIPEISAGQQLFFPIELTAVSNSSFTLNTYIKDGTVEAVGKDGAECSFNTQDTSALLRALELADDVFWNGNPLTLIRACSGAADEYGGFLNQEMDQENSPLHDWSWLPVKNACHHANLLMSPPVNGERRYYIIWHFPTLNLFPVSLVGGQWVPCDSNGIKSSRSACPLHSDTGRLNWSFSGDGICPLWDSGTSKDITVIQSFDPNDKVGPNGYGAEKYLSGEEPLRYSIFFENYETATAPAQDVFIADQLNNTSLILNDFNFGPISFGDTLVNPPKGLMNFTTDVVVPGRILENILVRITGNLNPENGFLSWRFRTIDPATGNPPVDPREGFLPPNVNPPEGDGSVLFTITPKDLPTGTEICNKANIVFDTNEPIVTPDWCNTLDNDAPSSTVIGLDTIQTSADFEVQWDGTDMGAGIRDYTIYVSEDGASYTQWLTNTADTMGVFSGEDGKTYDFYSIARDGTGNLEEAPTIPDTSTTVVLIPSMIGDFNGDACVDRGDYNILMTDIRNGEPNDPKHDLNEDGIVNRADARSLVGLFTNPRGATCLQE
ncbi:MAG: LamG-like jellyroll fold domain-containing protein [Candidatus Thiodiazotropha sp. 6PLUC1]